MTRIVLVRHGESVAQARQVVAGHGCQGLTELGRRQVGALRDRIASTGELGPAAALYASSMARARQTAEILAPALGGSPVTEDCDFCELHPGEMDGLSWAEVDRLFPGLDFSDPHRRRAPGAETWSEMAARTAAGLDRLAARHTGETVVVACHGGVIVHSMIRWLDLSPGPGRRARLEPANASVTEWALPEGAGAAPAELVRYNDRGHL